MSEDSSDDAMDETDSSDESMSEDSSDDDMDEADSSDESMDEEDFSDDYLDEEVDENFEHNEEDCAVHNIARSFFLLFFFNLYL